MIAKTDRLKSGTVSITPNYLFLLRENRSADNSNAERWMSFMNISVDIRSQRIS